MALGTIGYLAMDIMTEGTGKSSMLALILAQFINLWSMAGQARIGYIIAEFNHLGSMRI